VAKVNKTPVTERGQRGGGPGPVPGEGRGEDPCHRRHSDGKAEGARRGGLDPVCLDLPAPGRFERHEAGGGSAVGAEVGKPNYHSYVKHKLKRKFLCIKLTRKRSH